MPLLERKREILAGMAKERMEEGRNQHSPSVNLPEATKETRDSIAAEIGRPNQIAQLVYLPARGG